jgi:hypothetical protein
MNNFQIQKMNKSNKLIKILEFASNVFSEKNEIIKNYKDKIISYEENDKKEINNSKINEFLQKLSQLMSEKNEHKTYKDNNDLNLNSDIHLIENFSTENSNHKQIFILLFNIINNNNFGNLNTTLTEKIIESFIFLKNIENFMKISIEQFEKIKFILNERIKQFFSNYLINLRKKC